MVFLVNMQGKDMSEEESLAERMSREEEDNPVFQRGVLSMLILILTPISLVEF